MILFTFTQFLLLLIEEKSSVEKKVKKVTNATKVKEKKEAAKDKKTKADAKPEKDKPYTDDQRKDLIIYMSSWFIHKICIQNF